MKLVDQISGPAQKANHSLHAQQQALHDLEKQLKAVEHTERLHAVHKEKDPYKKQLLSLRMHRDMLKEHVTQTRSATPQTMGLGKALAFFGGASGLASSAFSLLSDVVSSGIGFVFSLTERMVGLGLAIGKTVVHSNDFARAMISSFEVIHGDRATATDMVARIETMATAVGFADDKLVEMGLSLQAAGFKARETQDILAAGLDVSAFFGGAEKGAQRAQALFDLMSRLRRGEDKIQGGHRLAEQLAGAGVRADAFRTELAKIKGISEAAAAQLIDQGRVAGVDANTAILQAIGQTIDKGQGLGTRAMKGLEEGWGAQVQRLRNQVGDLFKGIPIQPLVNALARVSAMLDSADGQRLAKGIRATVEKIISLIDQVSKSGVLEKVFSGVADVIENLPKALDKAIPLIKAFASGFSNGIGKLHRSREWTRSCSREWTRSLRRG
jgi:hypothetical protein